MRHVCLGQPVTGQRILWTLTRTSTWRAVSGHVRHHPLVIAVHADGLRAAVRAHHRPALSPRPHQDYLARILDILDDQRRHPREHSAHKSRYVTHD